MGVEFKCGVNVGQDVTVDNLSKDYDAVVLAVGCGDLAKLGIEGEDLDGIHSGLDVLKAAKNDNGLSLSGSLAVIGGGNVAVDAAQVALRLGADKVTVISLESADNLPAFPEEVKNARLAGIAFEHSWGSVRFLAEEGKVSGVELQRCLAVFDAGGAFRPEFDSSTRKKVAADSVIVAIGQHREESFFRGLGEINELTLQAGESNVFLAGDCYTGPSSAVKAMAGGRRAAESVNRLLANEHLSYGRSYAGPIETEFDIDISLASDADRAEPPRKVFKGKGDFAELEGPLGESTAKTEAGRCYSCGAPFGKFRTCWFCLPCEVECPEDALWVEIPYLLR
jgi:NADPH-dependent glutamate synthase beta subunit-like oxidoreductase